MCAGGIPTKNKTNALDCVQAAIKMQQYMIKRYQDKKRSGIPYWQMRIGIHTGPLVAGVVGKDKIAYDIWGDTVNLAKRMEEAAHTDMINISKETNELVSSEYSTSSRGKVAIKNDLLKEMFTVDYLD